METLVRVLALLGLCVPIGVLVSGMRVQNAPESTTSAVNRSVIRARVPPHKRIRRHKLRSRSKGRRRRRQSATSASNALESEADSDEWWRVKLASGRFMYQLDGDVVASRHFFSLFALRSIRGSSAHLLSLHGGGWLGPVAHGSQRLAVLRSPSPPSGQFFWVAKRSSSRIVLSLQPDHASYLCEHAHRPGIFLVGNRTAQSENACGSDEVELHKVVGEPRPRVSTCRANPADAEPCVPGATLSENNGTHPDAFERTLRRSAMQVGGRQLVLATYHNVGMVHWATLFWGWLQVSGIAKLLLLDLDGLTCGASKTLLGLHALQLQIECATAADMTLGKQYVLGKTASGLQDWGAPHPAPLSNATAEPFHPCVRHHVELGLLQVSEDEAATRGARHCSWCRHRHRGRRRLRSEPIFPAGHGTKWQGLGHLL